MTRTTAKEFAKRHAKENGMVLRKGQKIYKMATGKVLNCEVVYGSDIEDYDIIVLRPIPHKRDYAVSEFVSGKFIKRLAV